MSVRLLTSRKVRKRKKTNNNYKRKWLVEIISINHFYFENPFIRVRQRYYSSVLFVFETSFFIEFINLIFVTSAES